MGGGDRIALALLLQQREKQINPKHMDEAAEVGAVVGQYIHTHWKQGSTIALNTAGSTPYSADEMQYIDMLGLNDALIAHRTNIPRNGPWVHLIGHLKGDGLGVLARRPDYIILGPANGVFAEAKDKPFFIGDYEISTSSDFKIHYEPCVASMPNGIKFTYYERIDLHLSCPGS